MFFDNTIVEVYGVSDVMDEYGETGYEFKDKYSADIQPVNPVDSQMEFGKILQDTYNLYLVITADVDSSDIIKIGDETYEILGTPEKWNHILPHLKIIIKKHHKPVIQ